MNGNITLAHAGPGPLLLADSDPVADFYNRHDIEAMVASGDCFITLATTLDDCTRFLSGPETKALPQIEEIIGILFYLQRHYKVVRNPSER